MKKTELVIIVDRSGSMNSNNFYIEMQNGINHFIKEQAAEKGKCKLTLTQFDTIHDIIHDGVDIKEVPEYQLQPRGGTALLDAIGQTIGRMKERLADKKRVVVFLIVTDGEENSSHEYTKAQINDLVKAQEGKGWIFTFLGANQDAIQEGSAIGIHAKNAVNFTQNNTMKAYTTVSAKVGDMRAGKLSDVTYDSSERASLVE